MQRLLAGLLFLSFAAWADFGPIQVRPLGSVTISCTSSSGATALPSFNGQVRQLELQNVGANTIFVETGDSTVAAVVATSYPVLAGQSKVITIPGPVTHVACITASVTTTLYVTTGLGQ